MRARSPLFRPKPGEADPRLYQAAVPGYGANFSRDSLIYGLLADDLRALQAQIGFSARHQGQRADSATGEEPGKIHHELPAVHLRGLWTSYNACDTTALFIIALNRLAHRGDRGVAERFREQLERAVAYIDAHLDDDVFYEDTKQSGASRFALKVTYWKDSELNVGYEQREAQYPIAYSLVHFQCKTALRAAARLTGSRALRRRSEAMVRRGFQIFWRGDHFAVAVQGDGTVIDNPSTDSLHALLFLWPSEVSREDVERIAAYSAQLATAYGYLPALAERPGADDYHTRWVWVHEQALLHAAARRHGLEEAERISERITPALVHGFPELVDPMSGQPGGNPTQLWSIGANVYFQRARVATALARLTEPNHPLNERGTSEVGGG